MGLTFQVELEVGHESKNFTSYLDFTKKKKN